MRSLKVEGHNAVNNHKGPSKEGDEVYLRISLRIVSRAKSQENHR